MHYIVFLQIWIHVSFFFKFCSPPSPKHVCKLPWHLASFSAHGRRRNHLAAGRAFQPPVDEATGQLLRPGGGGPGGPGGPNASTVSFVLVRHPLSRLVSAYHSKFVALGLTAWNEGRGGGEKKPRLPWKHTHTHQPVLPG